MCVREFQSSDRSRLRCEILQQPFTQSVYLRLNFVVFDAFILQLELEFETLYFYFSLFLMLEDALVRFSVLWRCFGPNTGTISRRFMDTQC